MRISEIRVNQIRVNQGLGVVLCHTLLCVQSRVPKKVEGHQLFCE